MEPVAGGGGHVALTKPFNGSGMSASVSARDDALDLPPDVHVHPELGWCVRLVPREGIIGQMGRLKRLKESEPTSAAYLIRKAEELVQLSAQGNLVAIKGLLSEILAIPAWARPPPLWHVARMIRAAAPEGHVDVVRWMVEGGGVRPCTVPPLADIVHLVVERAPPSLNGSPPQSTIDMISLLVTAGKFDPSVPRKSDGWTPLHVACARNLTQVGIHLINIGADINAVGNDDKMPLNLADRMAAMLFYQRPIRRRKRGSKSEEGGSGDAEDEESEEDIEEEEDDDDDEDEEEEGGQETVLKTTPLQDALLEKGARRTWRKHSISLTVGEIVGGVKLASSSAGDGESVDSKISDRVRFTGGGSQAGGTVRFTGFAGGSNFGGVSEFSTLPPPPNSASTAQEIASATSTLGFSDAAAALFPTLAKKVDAARTDNGDEEGSEQGGACVMKSSDGAFMFSTGE